MRQDIRWVQGKESVGKTHSGRGMVRDPGGDR